MTFFLAEISLLSVILILVMLWLTGGTSAIISAYRRAWTWLRLYGLRGKRVVSAAEYVRDITKGGIKKQ